MIHSCPGTRTVWSILQPPHGSRTSLFVWPSGSVSMLLLIPFKGLCALFQLSPVFCGDRQETLHSSLIGVVHRLS